MSDAQSIEQFFRERGFGQTLGWGESPALLVIDYMRAFTDPALPLGSTLDRELAETVRVLGAAREAEVPIYFTAVWYEEKDLRDAGLWAKKMAGVMTLRAGTAEVEIDPRLGRRPDEPILVKKYASVFFGTDLISRLTARRTDAQRRGFRRMNQGWPDRSLTMQMGFQCQPALNIGGIHQMLAQRLRGFRAVRFIGRVNRQTSGGLRIPTHHKVSGSNLSHGF